MTIQILNFSSTNEQDLGALLTLFRNSSIDSDYMAIGEIRDMDTLRKVLSNKNLIHFFGYEDEIPVAYCQVIYKAESANFRSGAKINAVSVLPKQRGKGLGKALLKSVVAELQKNENIKNIYLEVVRNNLIAINLYKEIGFEKVGELKSLFTKHNILLDIEIYSLLVN